MKPSSSRDLLAPCGPDDAAVHAQPPAGRTGRLGRVVSAAAFACALALAGCGGGADIAIAQSPALQVGVIAGSTVFAPVASGEDLAVAAAVGQSIEFDANEPVVWSFSVNGSPLFADGTTVDLGGVTVTQSQVSASRVVIDSSFYGPALVPIDVLLTATSTIDAAQVATVRLTLQ